MTTQAETTTTTTTPVGATLLDAALRAGLVPLPLALGRALALICDEYMHSIADKDRSAHAERSVRVPAGAVEMFLDDDGSYGGDAARRHTLRVRRDRDKDVADDAGAAWHCYAVGRPGRDGAARLLDLYRDSSASARFAVRVRSLASDIGATRACAKLLRDMDAVEWAAAAGADIALRLLVDTGAVAPPASRDAQIVARVGARVARYARPTAADAAADAGAEQGQHLPPGAAATHWLHRHSTDSVAELAPAVHAALAVAPLPDALRRRRDDGGSDIEDLAFDAPPPTPPPSFGAQSDAQWRLVGDTLDAIRGRAAADGDFRDGVDNHPVLLAQSTILWQRDALAAARAGRKPHASPQLPGDLDPTVVLLACDSLRYAHALGMAAVAAAGDSFGDNDDDDDGNGDALSVPVDIADWLDQHALRSQRYAPAMTVAPLTLVAQLVRLLQHFAAHYDGTTHAAWPVQGTLRLPIEDDPDAIGGLRYRMRLPRNADRAAEQLRGLALLVCHVELVSAVPQTVANEAALSDAVAIEAMLTSALAETPEYERTGDEALRTQAALAMWGLYGEGFDPRHTRRGDRLVHEAMLELLLSEMTTRELRAAARLLARLFASSVASALRTSMERGRDALARQALQQSDKDVVGLLGAVGDAGGDYGVPDDDDSDDDSDDNRQTDSTDGAITVPAGGRDALRHRVLVFVDAAAGGLLLEHFPGTPDRWERRARVPAPAARAVAEALVRALARRAMADTLAPVRAAIGLDIMGLVSSPVLRDVARDVGMGVLDMIRELLTVHTPALIRIVMAILGLVPAVTAVATGVGVPMGVLGIFMSLVSIFREVVTIAGALFDRDGPAFRIIARIVRFVIGIFQRPAVKDQLPAEAHRTLDSMDRGMERIDDVARAAAAKQAASDVAPRPQASIDEVQALADSLPAAVVAPAAAAAADNSAPADGNAAAIAELERQIAELRAAQQAPPHAMPQAVAVAAHIGSLAGAGMSAAAAAAAHRDRAMRLFAAEAQLLRAVRAVTAAVHAAARTPEQRAALARYAGVCRLLTNAAIAERHAAAGSALAGARASIGAPTGLGRLLSHPVVSAVLTETGATVADVVGEIAKLGAAGLAQQAGTLLSLAVATLIVGVPVVGLLAVPRLIRSVVSLVRQNMGIIRALLRADSLVARIFVRIIQNFVAAASSPAISGHLSEEQLSELSEIDQFVAEALGDLPDAQKQQQPPPQQQQQRVGAGMADQAAFVRQHLSAKLAAEFPLAVAAPAAAASDPWGGSAPVPFLVGASAADGGRRNGGYDTDDDDDDDDDDGEPIPQQTPTTEELDRAVEAAVKDLSYAVARRGVRAAKDTARSARRMLNRLARRVERITAGARAGLSAEQRKRVAVFEDEWRRMLELAARHARADRIAQIRTQISLAASHAPEPIGARPGRRSGRRPGHRRRPRPRAPPPRRPRGSGVAHALGGVVGGVLGGAAAAAAAGFASGAALGAWDAVHGGTVRSLPLELVAPLTAPALMTPAERLLAERYFVYKLLPTPHWALRYELLGYYDAVGPSARRRRRMYRMKPYHRARI